VGTKAMKAYVLKPVRAIERGIHMSVWNWIECRYAQAGCGAVAGLLVLPLALAFMTPSAEAKSKQFSSNTSTYQSRRNARNTGINRTLSPNLSCAHDERNNNVTKGALYGAGSGLLIGGPIGAVAGAGAGALINQEQNRDACR
jgi:hypothetical protein